MNIYGETEIKTLEIKGEIILPLDNPLCMNLPYIEAISCVHPNDEGKKIGYYFSFVAHSICDEKGMWTAKEIRQTVEELEGCCYDTSSETGKDSVRLDYITLLGRINSIGQVGILIDGGCYDHVCEIQLYVPHPGRLNTNGVHADYVFDECDRVYDMAMMAARYAFQLGMAAQREKEAGMINEIKAKPENLQTSAEDYSSIMKGIKTQMHGEPDDDDDDEEAYLLTKMSKQEEDEDDDEVYGEDELDKELEDEDDDTDFSLDP